MVPEKSDGEILMRTVDSSLRPAAKSPNFEIVPIGAQRAAPLHETLSESGANAALSAFLSTFNC
jgi:hypothetical protein